MSSENCFKVGVLAPEGKVPTLVSFPPWYRDLTAEDSFSFDPGDAKVREDCFSIRLLEDGSKQITVQVINATHFIPYGSAADLHARDVGHVKFLELDGQQGVSSLLCGTIRKRVDLSAGSVRPVFALTFRVDNRDQLIHGSEEIFLAKGGAKTNLTLEDFDEPQGRLRTDPRITQLVQIVLANQIFSSAIRRPSRLEAIDIVYALTRFF